MSWWAFHTQSSGKTMNFQLINLFGITDSIVNTPRLLEIRIKIYLNWFVMSFFLSLLRILIEAMLSLFFMIVFFFQMKSFRSTKFFFFEKWIEKYRINTSSLLLWFLRTHRLKMTTHFLLNMPSNDVCFTEFKIRIFFVSFLLLGMYMDL